MKLRLQPGKYQDDINTDEDMLHNQSTNPLNRGTTPPYQNILPFEEKEPMKKGPYMNKEKSISSSDTESTPK